MTFGEFKRWAIENEITDDTPLYYSCGDVSGTYPIDRIDKSLHIVGIATTSPRSETVVEFS